MNKSITFEIVKTVIRNQTGTLVRLDQDNESLPNCNDLLLIATWCIKAVGQQQGLDLAFEKVQQAVYQAENVRS